MLTTRPWLIGGSGALVGFIALAALVSLGGGHDVVDSTVTDAVVGSRSPGLTVVAQLVTFVGSAQFLVPLTLALLTLIAWRRRHWLPVATMAGLAWLSLTGVAALKDLLARPRPPAADELGALATDPSLPSGHTTMSTVVYLLAAVILTVGAPAAARRTALLLAAAVVGLVGASRIYLGYHWLSDVVAGWLLGFAIVAAGACLVERFSASQAPTTVEIADQRVPATPVACCRNSLTFGGVQVRASQGRRGRDTGRICDEENAARCVPGGRQASRDFGNAPLKS